MKVATHSINEMFVRWSFFELIQIFLDNLDESINYPKMDGFKREQTEGSGSARRSPWTSDQNVMVRTFYLTLETSGQKLFGIFFAIFIAKIPLIGDREIDNEILRLFGKSKTACVSKKS